MHVAFLLVTRKEYRPAASIELDGVSHQGERRQARDRATLYYSGPLALLSFPELLTEYERDPWQPKQVSREPQRRTSRSN